MNRLARLRRILLRFLIVCTVLSVAAVIGLRFYLHSDRAAREIEEQIRLALGVPAHIGSARIAFWGESSVSELSLIDESDGRPFLQAKQAETDLSVYHYLQGGGSTPRRIELLHAHLRLSFDRDGSLLTKLPSPPPGDGPLMAILVRDARLTIEQQGRPAFSLEGVSIALDPSRRDNLSGSIDDPVWGKLAVTGRFELGGAFSLTLDNKSVALTHAMLRSLPLVPPALWTKIEADGPSVAMNFKLTIGKKAPRVRYTVAFDRARVTLPQPDRRALVVSSARGVLHGTEEGFLLNGALSDPYWGDWSVAAGLVARTGALTLELNTRQALVDQKKLEALPYVPMNVWKQVQASGLTSVHVLVGLSTRNPDVHYRVELAAKETAVHVSSIDLRATDSAGDVIVEDARVSLRKVTGRTAGGAIATNAELDFTAEPVRMKFDVEVNGLALRQLPKKWELPSQVEGKLTGQAKLTVTLRDGNPPETTGEGKGRIDEVKLVGLPAKPIQLDLTADGKRIRIMPQSTLLHLLMYAASPAFTSPPLAPLASLRTIAKPAPAAAQTLIPNRLIGQAVSGVGSALHWIVGGASQVLHQVARIDEPLKPGAQTVYLNATVSLDDVDLADLAKRLGVQVPVDLAGRLSFRVRVGIPVNSAREFKAYRLEGWVRLSRLSISSLEFADVRADVRYDSGLLRLEELSGRMGAGTIAGNARLQLLPRGDAGFDLKLRDLPAATVVRPIAGLALKADGALSGTIRASVNLDMLRDPRSWTGVASFRAPVLTVQGVTLRDVSANFSLIHGLAALSDLRGELFGGPLTGSAALSLSNTERFQGELQLRGLELSRLTTIPPPSWPAMAARGSVSASAEFRGSLNPRSLSASGKLSSGPVQLCGARVDRMSLGWTLADGTVKVSDFKAALYRGEATGKAEAPLSDLSQGRVDVKITDVDLTSLADSLGGLPFRLDGRVSGTAVGKYTPGPSPTKPGTWSAEVDLSAATLRMQDLPVQKLTGKLEYRDGKAEYRLEGETLGGKLSIEGKLPPPPMKSVDMYDGRLRLEHVALSRLWQALRLHHRLGPLHGVLTVDMPFRHEGATRSFVGQGRAEVRDLRYHGNELSESVRADVRLTADGIDLRDLSGEFADGMLRASISYRFRDPSRSRFSLSLSHVEASRVLVFEEIKDAMQGPIDLTLRGGFGSEWRGAGSLELSRGKVFGVEVSEWRVPLEFSFAPRTSRGELMIRESSAQVGHGRAQLTATLNWSDHMRIEGGVRFFDASLRSLGGILGDVSSYAQGKVTGRIEFAGGEVRSVKDLTATAEATLREAQTLQLPIFNLIVPYLLPGQGGSTFRAGEVHARLSNGIWRLSQMTLENNIVHLIIQGTIAVQGQIDLEVTGRTTTLGGLNPVLLRVLLTRLPPVGPVPVGLIFQATELLSNRLIRLRITGTTKSPRVQVEALQVLSEEAVRFFLTRALVP